MPIFICLMDGGRAGAGWESTRWGMTVDEVKAAIPGADEIEFDGQLDNTGFPLYALLARGYGLNNQFYIAVFYFQYGHLHSVGLKPISIKCDELRNELLATHGDVRPQKVGQITIFRWEEIGDNRLVLIMDPRTKPDCTLYYAKRMELL